VKTTKEGYLVFESVKEEQEWVHRYMAEHPGSWVQCPTCLSWRQSKNKPRPDSRCAQCPPKSQSDEGAAMPDRKPGVKIRGSRDRRDWANYH